ncbi:DUF4012 domain-containing protein [Nocardioides panacisoli]|uniref:DUF4012 domain-containing protein n=1 Tax=Nocardioides panacisoli TaxID=627624 RepID=UPI001C634857|nr:DUF4012 domain-containing protein [Nocardioides panacisoli]QYJ03946.1 DUF4012 domain-containing protein [Nocardioides panacisoli]
MSPEVRRRRRTRGLRRLKRLARERPLLPVLGAVAVLVLLAGAWSLWRVVSVAQDLGEVERSAQIMRAALVRGDTEGAREALDRYQEAAQGAADGTDGPVWHTAEALPVVGDDAAAVAVVAEVLADIGGDGLEPLAVAANDLRARSFHPSDGVFPLERIAALREPAGRSEDAFAAAGVRLEQVESDGLVGPVWRRVDALRQLVDDAAATLDAAHRAARLMPSLLGADGPRDYLLVMQNNAELRSSGGLPGSISRIHAEDGRVEIVEQVDMADIQGNPTPVLPLAAEERSIFGSVLGTVGVNATLTPDVPRSADLIRARWEQEVGGSIDGVFLVDPVTVSYLLGATGPVAVPGYGGVAAATVVAQVEHQVYVQNPSRDVHSDYQNAVAEAVFEAFTDGRGRPAAVIRGLATAVAEGRVRMHSFVARDQRVITGTQIAGELAATEEDRPRAGLYLNDAGETKMSYYLRYDASLAASSCVGGVQELSGAATLVNDSPPEVAALPPAVVGYPKERRRVEDGQQLVVAYLMSPVGGEVVELGLGAGRSGAPAVQTYRGREVATVSVLLDPQESREISFRMRGARGQVGAPELFVTPGATPGSASRTVRSAC